MTTPDRFPGTREEEELKLEPSSSDPAVVGAVRLVSGDFRLRDNLGVFNPREGSAPPITQLIRDLSVTWQPIIIGEDVWTRLACVIFRGTDYMGTPVAIKLAAYSEDVAEPVEIKILDITNGGAVICGPVTITPGTPTIIDAGTLTNLSTDEALWEIQGEHTVARSDDGWLLAMSVQL